MANSELDELTQVIVDDLDVLLDYFKIQFQRYHDRYSFPCPVHESDNDESLSIFISGHTSIGNWKCWTNGCQDDILSDDKPLGRNIFGLIRGLIGAKEDREVSYREAIQFAKELYGFKSNKLDYKLNVETSSKNEFIKSTKILDSRAEKPKGTIVRQEIRSRLKIPAQYFIGRGFSAEILDKYDVGYCETQKTQMFNRVVVPVYDEDYNYMVGCVGRTTEPKCNQCGFHHAIYRHCPENNIEKRWGRKWINSAGFKADTVLYNYWFARDHIMKSGWAILVEGQGDVWKLEMAGFHIGLGIFGDALGDGQKELLDASGALNLLILTDNDEAGLAARKKIKKKCERSYNCHFLDLPDKDIGDMQPEHIKTFLEPILGGVL